MTIKIILGAAVWYNGASLTLRRKTLCGAPWYHAGRVTHLILCGGLGIHPPTETQAMLGILRTENVPDSAMTLEKRSTTTGENLRHAFDLTNIHDAIIITDWYHAPRPKWWRAASGFQ